MPFDALIPRYLCLEMQFALHMMIADIPQLELEKIYSPTLTRIKGNVGIRYKTYIMFCV